jgi:hypothetical protein
MVRIVADPLQQTDSRLRHSLDKPVEVPVRIKDRIVHSIDDIGRACYRFSADGCHIDIELQKIVRHHTQRLRARRVSIGEIEQVSGTGLG